ncbi:hypothetical protein [Sigmofec virus UA08Rod_4343]|uniref:Uncharacterized protein n=1 Tax=Sigmofec virus UA08Rod_4343 TaxID=2929400 RepID=A0A976N1Y6_9VIRU|nr:hypothetical protein [Sigmofec virus UA08Rod_4343]
MARKRSDYIYVGFYVPKDVHSRLKRMFPNILSHIMRNFLDYALEHKSEIYQKYVGEEV